MQKVLHICKQENVCLLLIACAQWMICGERGGLVTCGLIGDDDAAPAAENDHDDLGSGRGRDVHVASEIGDEVSVRMAERRHARSGNASHQHQKTCDGLMAQDW